MKKVNSKMLILFFFITLYIFIFNILLIDNVHSIYNAYLNPIIWLILFIIAFYFKDESIKRFKDKKNKGQTIFIIVLVYIIVYCLSGLIFGYTRSPYSHTIVGLLYNFWILLIPIIFKEYVRCFLANGTRKNIIFWILITLIFIFSDINFYNFNSNFISAKSTYIYISATIFPIIIKNILYTYLAITCGYISTLLYRLTLQFTLLLLPIFPNLDWFVNSIYEVLLAIIVFVYINFIEVRLDDRVSKRSAKKEKPIKKIPYILFIFVLVGFLAGLFKYSPIAIVSNSMAKVINKGDVVIVNKLSDKEIDNLKEGDVIEYSLDNQMIIHRIIKISTNYNNEVIYITKGDNNNTRDLKPVKRDQIKGKILCKIPKLGYPALIFNELFEKSNKPNVELGK